MMKGVFGIGALLPVWAWAIIAVGITVLFGNQLIGVASFVGSVVSQTGASLAGYTGALTGFTTLGLSSAQFTSNTGGVFTGDSWVLTVAQGGMGQHAEGIFSKADIASKSGEQPENDFKLSIDYAQQSCEYAIKRTTSASRIATYTYYQWGCALGTNYLSAALQYCPNVEFYGGTGALGGQCWCLNKIDQTSDISLNIENPEIRTKSTISVTGKSSATANVDTKGESRGYIGDKVYYVWNGDLYKSTCPSQAGYYGYYSQSRWHIGEKNSYTNYVNAYNNLVATAGAGGTPSVSSIQQLVNTVNSWANTALAEGSFATEINAPSSLDSAVIKKDVPYAVSSPVYTFYVKADFLGIYQPMPNIVISSVSSVNMNTFGTTTITLSNTGETANARVWIECSDTRFAGTTNNLEISVPENGQSSISMGMSANTGATASVSCNAKSNDGFHTSIKSFSVTNTPTQYCTPSQAVCTDSKTIKRCNSAGTGRDLIETCTGDDTCRYDSFNSPYCGSDDGGDGADWLSWLFNSLGAFIGALVIIAILLGLLWMLSSLFGIGVFIVISSMIFKNKKILAIIIIIGAALIALLFAGLSASIGASLIGALT